MLTLLVKVVLAGLEAKLGAVGASTPFVGNVQFEGQQVVEAVLRERWVHPQLAPKSGSQLSTHRLMFTSQSLIEMSFLHANQ